MAEMERFLAELTELTEMVNAADSGLAALGRLVEMAQGSVGGVGAAFAEYGPAGGRLVAASGACARAVGSPLDPDDLGVARLLAQGRLMESSVDDLPAGLRVHTGGRGVSRMLGARAELAGRLVGSLHVYLAADTPATALQRSALSFFAAVAVHLYEDRRGLPLHDDAPTVFAAVTSHELRTPVTVIKGYADTLVDHWDRLDESSRREIAQRLRQRSGDLARLVGRLLAAVGDGTVPAPEPVNAPFDLGETLRTAVAELSSDLREAVRLDLPDSLPKALGERAGIATVFAELITNAVKYSAEGQQVEVTALVDAYTVGFRVADRGIGISAEHMERAFDRFWRAETGDRRRYDGIGLGLYLVRQIVERQNGWVFLRPRERGGTVAEVRLRRAAT